MKNLIDTLNENQDSLKQCLDESFESLLEMSNFSKDDTSLPMIVWIQVKTTTQHNMPRMKFANNNSNSLLPKDLVPISISDNPQILSKNTTLKISTSDFEKLRQWIIRNKEALLKVWNGELSTGGFMKAMK